MELVHLVKTHLYITAYCQQVFSTKDQADPEDGDELL